MAACFVIAFATWLCAQGKGWSIPEGAQTEQNPLAGSPRALAEGESLYKSNCAGCHGRTGLGDGPNVDRRDRAQKPANLTLSRNPEGVVYYKIWNGRKNPDMPAFKSRMTKNEAWSVVTYVLSLRSQ